MLEKPDLQDETITACLQEEFGLRAAQITFLPLGADQNTAVYRAVVDNGMPYFVKLRSGIFDEISVELPKFLSDQGVRHVIAPLTTRLGKLWASLGTFKMILYPFVDGRNGYDVTLSERHWLDFGAALKRIHTIVLPVAFSDRIRRETYSSRWRKITKTFLEHLADNVYEDPVAMKCAAFLRAKYNEIGDLVGRTEHLAASLLAHPPGVVLCHSDVHAGNILIDADETLYIIDWDDPILAPKERDLMFIGGAQGFTGYTAQEEEALFYRGYGQIEINPLALAYYRYERIVQDIAAFCSQIFLTHEGGKDREQALNYLMSNFLPDNTIETAYRTDKTLSK